MGHSVEGCIRGRSLAVAMIKAHAATAGKMPEKRAAGVGMLINYLAGNSVRGEAWNKATKLPPEVVIARASLSSVWLQKAGEILENSMENEMRKDLLSHIIDPHFRPDPPRLYDYPFYINSNENMKNKFYLGMALDMQPPTIELEMVNIPAGKFKMGSAGFGDEQPVREIMLSGFLGAKYGVTNEQYRIFIEQTGHIAPAFWSDPVVGGKQDKKPVVGINYNDDSKAFVDWLGLRLFTEAEREYAARGPKGSQYPLGNVREVSTVMAAFKADGPAPVDAHKEIMSWCGLYDLSGNVKEWVGDWYAEKYDPNDLIDPKGPATGTCRVIRGGDWRATFRDKNDPVSAGIDVGLRVAGDMDN
jgi:formylglycine-generating enzyme required for sulfatase activity